MPAICRVRAHVLKILYSEESPFRDYPLVLCGHSLGAGVASILSIMLRPSFPSLKCFAYCPPGAVVDDGMAKKCEQFIFSFVRQDDLSKCGDWTNNNQNLMHFTGTNIPIAI